MDGEQKMGWEQIVLPLGLMAAVFIFVGSRNSNVRIEAGYPNPMDPYYQALKEACAQNCSPQKDNEGTVCASDPNSSKCQIAKEATRTCKIWYDANCGFLYSNFAGSSSGGGRFSASSFDSSNSNNNDRLPYTSGPTSGAASNLSGYQVPGNAFNFSDYNPDRLNEPYAPTPCSAPFRDSSGNLACSGRGCELDLSEKENFYGPGANPLICFEVQYASCKGPWGSSDRIFSSVATVNNSNCSR